MLVMIEFAHDGRSHDIKKTDEGGKETEAMAMVTAYRAEKEWHTSSRHDLLVDELFKLAS